MGRRRGTQPSRLKSEAVTALKRKVLRRCMAVGLQAEIRGNTSERRVRDLPAPSQVGLYSAAVQSFAPHLYRLLVHLPHGPTT